MSRTGFQKSTRMFHKFSEETMRRRGGGDPAGRESIAALAKIEAVLKAERLLDASLLEPLAAFTNLLQSSQLPPDFGNYSFADALLALEESHAELRQAAEQRWEFAPELGDEATASLSDFVSAPAAASLPEHAGQLRRFVLDAGQQVEPGTALVVGALACPDLPLAELAARFKRLTLNDLDLPRLEELVRTAIPEPHRERVKLERYDATGSYVAFAQSVKEAVATAGGPAEAEHALVGLLESYDVGAGSAGLSAAEEKPDLAISAMVLTELGAGYAKCIASALRARGWDEAAAHRPPLESSLTLLRCLVAQHHIHALLRRAKAAVLVSPVSEVELRVGSGKPTPVGEPTDLLFVERLEERLPGFADIKAEQSWEWRRERQLAGEKRTLLTLVEAIFV